MFVPRNSSKCTNDIKAKNSFFCAYQITNKEWNKTVKVKFEVGETGSYEINNPDGLRVGFKTQERKLMGNKHWGNYITDETHVQVQIEVTRCNFRSRSKPRCVCAIGIRAGNDLFVIDRCPSRRLLIGFKSCGDNVLDARKITEFQYKVYFPTGMYVEILLDDNLFGERVKTMNVDIHPSLKNDNNINGLCGPMNKHKDVQRSIQEEQDEVWTMQKAKKYCESFMMKSVTFNVCKDIPNTRPDVSLENCALDIMLTNSTDWSDLTRRSMRMACMNEITYNNTIAEKRQNEAQSLAEKIRAISCPGDCSGHGICRKGQCACDVGFGAEDCSKDLSVPPLTYGVNVDDGGICDIAECPAAFVEGDGFLNSKDLKCKLQFFKANMNNSLTLLHHIVVNGEHDSLAEVHCPLPTIFKRSITYNDDSFVHGYLISISNNNRNYSSSHPLYFLDGRCQDTISIRGQLGFIVKVEIVYMLFEQYL
ncbi:hypothetical protein FSP39_016411 [Pinctada imbricata]|uniref:Vwde helical domain-containing protein n=1 Tax=Pinctada imbricata TaxID=66713 RepID=A0AA88XFZ4_PINIB|nr:hypothetical protein FSP39_016411 [Pinctada imbricata]